MDKNIKRADSLYGIRGLVFNVEGGKAGSALVNNVAVGDTVLHVDDASDFMEEGGTLVMENGRKYVYDSADMGTDHITLGYPIDEAFEDGDYVRVYPIVTTRFATVDVFGESDPLVAQVPHSLFAWMPLGTRANSCEEVLLVEVDGGWYVFDVLSARLKLSKNQVSNLKIFRYTTTGIGPDGYQGIKLLDEYDGKIYAAKMKVLGGPVSTDSTWSLLLNGFNRLSLVVPAGFQKSPLYAFNLDLDNGDRLSVEHTAPGDASPDVVVWLFVELNNDGCEMPQIPVLET